MNDVTVRFTITPDFRAAVKSFNHWFLFLFGGFLFVAASSLALLAAVATRLLVSHQFGDRGLTETLEVVLTAVNAFFGLQAAMRARCVPVEGELTFSEFGVRGTLGRREVTFGWADVVFVDRTETALCMRRRRGGSILIPIASVPDISALWTMFDRQLISRRNLVRSAFPTTRIINSNAAP